MAKKRKKDSEVNNKVEGIDAKANASSNDKLADKEEPANEENLQEKIQDLNEKYLRLFAEYENFRKRTIKEKEALYKNASAHVLTSLLPVVDDFERTMLALSKVDDVKTIKDGIEIIFKKFNSILTQQGIEPIKSIDEQFDTDFHEAISLVETDESKKDKVIQELEKGYKLKGEVIRFAKVIVGK